MMKLKFHKEQNRYLLIRLNSCRMRRISIYNTSPIRGNDVSLAIGCFMKNEYSLFVFAFLRGLSQIMLQENAATGLLFLIAIALGSPTLLIGTILGATIGMLTAKSLRIDRSKIHQGLFGYNAALVGMAVFYFFDATIVSALLIVFGSILSTHIANLFFKYSKKIPAYTAPFVIACWAMLILSPYLGLSIKSPDAALIQANNNDFNYFDAVGQVMFQESALVSVLFIIALGFHSIQAAIWAMIASSFALFCAMSFGFPDELIQLGLYGYNGVLVAIVLSAKFGLNLAPTLAGIIISVIFTRGFQMIEVPALTAPFVLACWLINGGFSFWQQKALKGLSK